MLQSILNTSYVRELKECLRLMLRDTKSLLSKTKYYNAQSELAQEGLVIKRAFLSGRKLSSLQSFVGEILSDKYHSNSLEIVDRGKKFGQDPNMIDVFGLENDAKFKKKFTRLVNDVQSFCQSNSERVGPVQNINIYFTRSANDPRCLHSDSISNQYKAFIYLTDVSSLENGPYCFVKKSHKASFRRILSFLMNFLIRSNLYDRWFLGARSKYALLGTPGDLILSDQAGAHGAHPQSNNGCRILVMFNFGTIKINSQEA